MSTLEEVTLAFYEKEILSGMQDDEFFYTEDISDVWQNCVLESARSTSPIIFKLIVSNLIIGITTSTCKGILSESIYHLLNGCIGVYLLTTLEETQGKVIVAGSFAASYFLLRFSHFMNKFPYVNERYLVMLVLVIVFTLSEYLLLDPDVWLQIRGIMMIMAMKVTSLSDDMKETRKLSGLQFFGYIFSGSSILFGPWISFANYRLLYEKTTKKTIWWLFGLFKSLLLALFFLSLSNCWSTYLIPDYSNRWLVAYREAFAFRTSHYFISHLSASGMVAAGFKDFTMWTIPYKWEFTVVSPLEIEFPSALVNVVTHWNRPMHEFLKKYVYRFVLPYGTFTAVFSTFVASSFLHGFELKVSVVLISIGIFSYLQVVPRNIIADYFSCCCRVRPCKNCNHKYKRNHLKVRVINIIYSLFTILHLVYLGVLMDPSTNEIGIYAKWQNLYFISHIIMIINVLMIL